MKRRFTGSLALLAMTLLVSACDSPQSSVAPPARGEFLQFEYQLVPREAVDIDLLNSRLQNGEIVVEETSLASDAEWCEYKANFEPAAGQAHADLRPDEQTHAPMLNAYGNPRSMGFNFIVSGFLARNSKELCGRLEDTIQGVEFTSSQGSASGSWRPGDEARAVVRPEMGQQWLGPGREFRNEIEGERLFFDHAVDSVSRHGFVEGRFTFLAVAESGDQVLLVRNGEFGMQNRR